MTQVTYKAISIPNQVWGGLKVVSGDQLEAVTNATLKYIDTVTDPKASLVTQYMGTPGQALPDIAISTFYNGPTPPEGIFDDFVALPSISDNMSGPRGMVPIVEAANSFSGSSRCVSSYTYLCQELTNKSYSGNYNTAAVEKASPAVINAVINETIVSYSLTIADMLLTVCM